MQFFSFWILFLWCAAMWAQPLGTWKLYFPYKDATGLEDAGTFVYVGGTQSIYSYEKATGVITFYDKKTALSDVGINCIDYNASTKTLAIAYNNSNIDLLVNETEVFNIPDLKNKVIAGTKNINAICNAGQRIYFASDVGILAVSQAKKEIAETYVIGKNGENVTVYDVAVGNNRIFAATEQGMKSASLNAVNLQNFNNWKTYSAQDFVPEKKFLFTEFASGKFYGVCNDTLFSFDGATWSKTFFDTSLTVLQLDSIGNDLLMMCNNKITGQGNVVKIDASGNQQIITGVVGRPIQYFVDNDGAVWKADKFNGVFRNEQSINPNSPRAVSSFNVAIKNNVTWISGGGTDASWGYTYNTSGMYVLENDKWTNFNDYSYPTLSNFPDIVNIAIANDGRKAWLASNREGLAEVDLAANTIQQFNKNNSPLQAAVADPVATRVTAVALDKNNNVWMVNSYTNSGIVVKKPTGEWLRLPYFNSGQLVKKLIITSNGYKWMLMRPGSISVYYDGNNLESTSDDAFRVLGTGKGNGGLNNANVNCIVEDKDGAVWVGTDEGIEIFYCARSVLSQNGCDAQRVIVQRDGFNGYLFSTEVVKALAVDAANRKWVGTNNGVWLISADGKEELLKFNVDNSPLPSNFITDIAVNQQTGEVFFTTEQGIASYLGDAIEGGETCNKATVFPNPITADYDGPIAVKGLVDDAYVKITDASGLLVHQGKANGGQMIWNAKTYNGNRVASGVYTVFSANELGKERCVAKIVIMN
jgi:hypothetical protein